MKKTTIYSIIIISISFLIGIYFYPLMPDQIASHWNSSGDVDGYMPKFWGLFLLPLILLATTVLLFLSPRFDPKKENIDKFKGSFESFIVVLNLFLLYVYILTIIWNMGQEIDISAAIIPAIGLFFFYLGSLIEKAKRNYMIGIRTPWTLSNDIVWDKTHKRGGKLFRLTGIITLLGVFFGQYAFWFLFVPIVISVVYLFVYSYFEYQKIES